jgi:hypothetical protein
MYTKGQLVKVRYNGRVITARIAGFSSILLAYVICPLVQDLTTGHPFYAVASDIFPQGESHEQA